MAEPEAYFTDWQQTPKRPGLLVDDDFSWSDAPTPRRRGQLALRDNREAVTGTVVIGRESGPEEQGYDEPEFDEIPAADLSEYDYPENVGEDGYVVPVAREAVYADDIAHYHDGPSGRRTVVITGRGSDRLPATRRRRDSDVAFYQRASFRPDSVAMWAVLLGLALLLGSIAH